VNKIQSLPALNAQQEKRTSLASNGMWQTGKKWTGTLEKGFNVVMDEVEPFDFFIEKK